MLDVVGWDTHRSLARRGITILPLNAQFQSAAGLQVWADEIGGVRFDTAVRRWHEDVKRCAQLTQTDGAVIFDPLLSPRAFGVKFLVTEPGTLPEAFRQLVGRRGMRHQSAASIVNAVPGSLAIVVSQDGGVTGFAHSSSGEKQCQVIM
jgi:hypothetical protein